jgi:hypothetical protein
MMDWLLGPEPNPVTIVLMVVGAAGAGCAFGHVFDWAMSAAVDAVRAWRLRPRLPRAKVRR